MTVAIMRQKLKEYIQVADAKKIKAIFILVEDDMYNSDWRNDKDFIAELERRSTDYKSGKDKGVPWEEVKNRILSSRKCKV